MTKLVRLAASLVVLVALCTGCGTPNQSPVISNLTASVETVAPSGFTLISCVAQDPDGDGLSYTWEANGGTISGEGASVTWVAPATSGVFYTITVRVSDGRGGQETGEVTVDVLIAGNTPPLIEDVVTTLPSNEIYDNETATLTCVATDPDGDAIVSYTWEATGGTISGQGTTITWAPPEVSGTAEFSLTVRATDSKGNRSQAKSIPIIVRQASGANQSGPNHLPVIDSVIAEWSQIERGKTGLIKCIAHDPDGDKLTYKWEPERGSISGKGSTVSYTAPLSYVDVIVNVIVSDGRGGTVAAGVKFEVVCCANAQRNPEWTG